MNQIGRGGQSGLEFNSGVEVFGVFTNDNQIDVGFAEIGPDAGEALAGTKTGKQPKLLSQKDVNRSKAFSDRCGDRGFESHLVFSNRGEHRVRDLADLFDDFDTAFLDIPMDFDAGRFHATSRRFGNFGTNTIARNQGNVMHLDC